MTANLRVRLFVDVLNHKLNELPILSPYCSQPRQTAPCNAFSAKNLLTQIGHIRIMRPATPMKVARKKMAT
ncbi:hypothetical protein CLM71_05565 [Serratia sp. MYb239]|nr:hypothetical protein CLM71_05565 [Serratia sp. MYb239]